MDKYKILKENIQSEVKGNKTDIFERLNYEGLFINIIILWSDCIISTCSILRDNKFIYAMTDSHAFRNNSEPTLKTIDYVFPSLPTVKTKVYSKTYPASLHICPV